MTTAESLTNELINFYELRIDKLIGYYIIGTFRRYLQNEVIMNGFFR